MDRLDYCNFISSVRCRYISTKKIEPAKHGLLQPTFIHSSRPCRRHYLIVTPYLQLLCVSFSAFCMIAIAVDLFLSVFSSTFDADVSASSSAPADWPTGSEVTPVASNTRRRRRAVRAIIIVGGLSALYAVRIAAENFSDGPSGTSTADNETSTQRLWTTEPMKPTESTGIAAGGRLSSSTGRPASAGLIAVRSSTEAGSLTVRDERVVVGNMGSEVTSTSIAVSCNLFVEHNSGDTKLRVVDMVLLFVLPIVVQLVLYVAVARKLWSSQVSHQP